MVLGRDIGVHVYADDLQIYSADYLANVPTLADRLTNCIAVVCRWLSANPQKTKFLWLGIGASLNKMAASSILVDGIEVSPAQP